ncbi:AMIN domain-containing protein [Chitinibacteraceae bacterium HSL-7]
MSKMTKLHHWVGGISVATLMCGAWAADITSIDVSTLSTEKQIIKVMFDGAPPQPTSFSIATPPRIAFDFAGAGNKAGKSSVQVNGASLRMINLAEGNGRTRLVLNLSKQVTYEAVAQGNAYVITVDGSPAKAAEAKQSTHFAKAAEPAGGTATSDAVSGVDFRRGVNGEGKVIVELSNPNVGIDVRRQGKTLVVDFPKTSVADAQQRRLDVADFGTPVQKIDTYRQGSNTRMVIEPVGN